MEVRAIEEGGFHSAMYGLSLSYRKSGDYTDFDFRKKENAVRVAKRLKGKNKGHNKFLEHMIVWLSVKASLEWWKQMDTYRVGVSKQSESTMHTLHSEEVTLDSYHLDKLSLTDKDKKVLHNYTAFLNTLSPRAKSRLLPQCYFQEREVVLSYKTIRHIIEQRSNHKLSEWRSFISQVKEQVKYKEFLED